MSTKSLVILFWLCAYKMDSWYLLYLFIVLTMFLWTTNTKKKNKNKCGRTVVGNR